VFSQGSNSWLLKVIGDAGLAHDRGSDISMIDFGTLLFDIQRILQRQGLAVS
jgi:hypothetical protein